MRSTDTDVPEAARELDVRRIEGPPFGHIVDALRDLDADDALVVVADFEPEPLYGELDRRGFDHRTRRGEDGAWRVVVERA